MATNVHIAAEAPNPKSFPMMAAGQLTEKQHKELERINRKAKVIGWTPTPIVQMPTGEKMLLLPDGNWMVA